MTARRTPRGRGAQRPNVLFICQDQLRYDATGPSRAGLAQTPHLDRLAAGGVWFEHAFTPVPTCCPARQSLLSGEWPDRHGGLWNYDNFLPVRLFDRPTWSQALSDAGYRAAYVGKWHVHPDEDPTAFGYDDYVPLSAYRDWRAERGLPDEVTPGPRWHGGHDPAPTEHARPAWMADQAVALLEGFANGDGPWHLRLEFEEPHIPNLPTREFLDLYDPAGIESWGNVPDPFLDKPYLQPQMLVTWGLEDWTWDDWRPLVHRYRATVTEVDAAVGRVLDALDRLGLADDTVVVYTSDHGDACGSHGMIDKHGTMYDEVVRVPLCVRWPGVARAGRRTGAFTAHFLDLAATMYEAAGLAVPAHVQGRSLVPVLRGDTPPDWPDAAFSVYNGQQFGLYVQRMVRTNRWKYVWNMTDTDELYDLKEDPWELDNRVGDPAVADALRDLRSRLLAHLEGREAAALKRPFVRDQLAEGRKLAAASRARR